MRGKFIIFIIIIALMAGAAGWWYWQKNLYSKEVLRLEILGPTETDALKEIEYTVKYKNNGNVTLEEPKLTFEYPPSSLPDGSKPLRQELSSQGLGGDIYPGEERTISFKGRLVGKENEVKKAKARIVFRPKNLKASYESETTFSTLIKLVPLTFELDLLSKLESGREFSFSLNYFSSIDFPLTDLRIKIEYPAGFELLKASPRALEGNEWEIDPLNKGEGGRIEIRGRVSGESQEEKIFRGSLGIWQKDEFVLLKETSRGAKIIKPLLAVFQRINGLEDYSAFPGEWLHYEIFFRNLGEEPFRQLFLVSKLESPTFDFTSLRTESGQINKEESSIIWDWREVSQLQFLGQGEEGKVEFWIKLKDWNELTLDQKNPILRNKVLIAELREEFVTKVSSKLEIIQAGYFEDEVFGNSGPLPPRVGEETTYTLLWQVRNCCSDVKNVKVKAVLGPQVKLTSQIFPESARLTFDSESREVVWGVGDLSASQAMATNTDSCAFQVSLKPSADQQGRTAVLIGEARILGEDQWTEEIIESKAKAVDTGLPDDRLVSEKGGVVE